MESTCCTIGHANAHERADSTPRSLLWPTTGLTVACNVCMLQWPPRGMFCRNKGAERAQTPTQRPEHRLTNAGHWCCVDHTEACSNSQPKQQRITQGHDTCNAEETEGTARAPAVRTAGLEARLLEAAARNSHNACGVEQLKAVQEVRLDTGLLSSGLGGRWDRQPWERVQSSLAITACITCGKLHGTGAQFPWCQRLCLGCWTETVRCMWRRRSCVSQRALLNSSECTVKVSAVVRASKHVPANSVLRNNTNEPTNEPTSKPTSVSARNCVWELRPEGVRERLKALLRETDCSACVEWKSSICGLGHSQVEAPVAVQERVHGGMGVPGCRCQKRSSKSGQKYRNTKKNEIPKPVDFD